MNCKDIARLYPLFLSGELDAPSALTFTEHLQACHGCASELDKQKQLDAVLRTSVLSEEIDSAAFDQRIRQHIASQRPAILKYWLFVAASIAAILLTGTIGYRAVFATGSTRLCVDAAQDHDREVIRREHRTWLSDPKAIADLARRNGLHGSFVTRLAATGYHLERGKLCRLDGRVFLHLVYAQGAGELSIYLRPLDDQQLSGGVREIVAGKILREADRGHDHVAYFQTSQLTVMFVTDQSSDAALSVARSAAHVL